MQVKVGDFGFPQALPFTWNVLSSLLKSNVIFTVQGFIYLYNWL